MADDKKTITVDPEVALKADTNQDGHISKEEYEMELEFKRKAFEDADARRDAMRQMAWFALFGMLLYPFAVVLASNVQKFPFSSDSPSTDTNTSKLEDAA